MDPTEAKLLAVQRPCHFAVGTRGLMLWVPQHAHCCIDPESCHLIIDLSQNTRRACRV